MFIYSALLNACVTGSFVVYPFENGFNQEFYFRFVVGMVCFVFLFLIFFYAVVVDGFVFVFVY